MRKLTIHFKGVDVCEVDIFREQLKKFCISITDVDLDKLVAEVTSNKHDSTISIPSFLLTIMPPMIPRRLVVLELVINKLLQYEAKDSINLDIKIYYDVTVSLDTMEKVYSVRRHPSKLSETELKQSFLNLFKETNRACVTVSELVLYYAGVSLLETSDTQFELLLIRSWNLDESLGIFGTHNTHSIDNYVGKDNPLYITTNRAMYTYDANSIKSVNKKHFIKGQFTKNYPGPISFSTFNM